MNLIPTFKVGERVRVVPKDNPEYACHDCGRPFHEKWFEEGVLSLNAYVLCIGPEPWECWSCKSIQPHSEGMYGVFTTKGGTAVPWTWLERIEGSDER